VTTLDYRMAQNPDNSVNRLIRCTAFTWYFQEQLLHVHVDEIIESSKTFTDKYLNK